MSTKLNFPARLAVITLCGVQFVDVLGVTSAITPIPAILRGLRRQRR
jgi:hypothetical protein